VLGASDSFPHPRVLSPRRNGTPRDDPPLPSPTDVYDCVAARDSSSTGISSIDSVTCSLIRGPQTYRVSNTVIVAVNGTASRGPSTPPIIKPQTKIDTITVIGCRPTEFPTMRGA